MSYLSFLSRSGSISNEHAIGSVCNHDITYSNLSRGSYTYSLYTPSKRLLRICQTLKERALIHFSTVSYGQLLGAREFRLKIV